MTQLSSNSIQNITYPHHYIADRSIEPIEVIEAFSLNHHLACALKYISRAGRKDCERRDLEKATWYLERFLQRGFQSLQSDYMQVERSFSSIELARDWCLSSELSMALQHIAQAPHSKTIFHVESAMKFIKLHLKQFNKKRKKL